MNLNIIILNNVNNRFLPIPESVSKHYEPEPKISDFEFIKELGTGSFGRVFLVYHKKTKVKYAIKAIDKKNKGNIEEKPYFRREIEIMYRIHHPNVVKLFGHFEDNNYCYFIMEYIPKGNVYSLIPKNGRKKKNHQIIASIVKDIISAAYYLHNMNPPIIHRDIKPENVLINDDLKAVLTDFGWSNYLNDDGKRSTICGTPIYLAPEMISQKGHDGRVDIWCIGVLLFELITGRVPFQGNDITTLKHNIRNMKISWPSDINYEAKDLISKILKYNPDDRLTEKEILNHSFIKKYYPNAVNELILPDEKIKYKIFVVSVDDPKKWNPILDEDDSYHSQAYPHNNKRIKRTRTADGFFKKKKYLSKNKYDKKKTFNNKENNYNTINTKSTDKYRKLKRYNKYTEKERYEKNKSSDNYDNDNDYYYYNYNCNTYDNYDSYENYYYYNYDNNKYEKYDDYDRNYQYDKNKKYDDLVKKYDDLKKQYNKLKRKNSNELDKLKKELKEKENKIFYLIKEEKLYDFSEREYRRKKKELKELEMIYEDLKIENHELKERVKYYSKYIEEQDKLYYDENFDEIRESINGNNKNKFSKAMNKLRYDLDEKTQNNFYAIIKEKEKQLEKYKKEEHMRRAKEKEKFSVLINKYDRTLSWQEQENKDLKIKLQELESQLI